MSDIDKIVGLLSSDAVERRIAAAIVLGEIKAKGVAVADALAGTLDSGIALLQRHALDALARIGAKRAMPKIFPLLAARDEEVRRAAIGALVSVGEDALPTLRARIAAAPSRRGERLTPFSRRSAARMPSPRCSTGSGRATVRPPRRRPSPCASA